MQHDSMARIVNSDEISYEIVNSILRDDMEPYKEGQLNVPTFVPRPGPWGSVTYFSTEARYEYLRDLCNKLFQSTKEPASHLLSLDSILSSILNCSFILESSGRLMSKYLIYEHELTLRALDLLKRLPKCALELDDLPSDLHPDYFWPQSPQLPRVGILHAQAWENLQVSTILGTNIIKMALSEILGQEIYPGDFSDEYAQLLDMASELAAGAQTHVDHNRWFIVRAILWSSWQRSIMLCYWSDLRKGLEEGFNQGGSNPKLRSTKPAPGTSIKQLSKGYTERGKSPSMCSWAFGLLRNETFAIGMDFRTFHLRYNAVSSGFLARCKSTSSESCSGIDPSECRRFTGLVVKDQSMHDYRCTKPCTKLRWDEESYRKSQGARAVPISQQNTLCSGLIKYCNTSSKTMAISHVWSHGQGGRPHDGINACLHRRYVDIAKSTGCESYWWDSICIPEDHELRSEAIQNINTTFARSQVILVCDKDIMNIDISNPSIQVKESILATTLVCDWNIRAWTFLESLRGRHQIHLLCKENRIISFRKVQMDVFRFGSIDLAILGLAVPHMLPQSGDIVTEDGVVRDGRLPSSFENRLEPKVDNTDIVPEFLRLEDAGSVLSYRPASRIGDNIVIWSLLTGEKKNDTPQQLWQENFADRAVLSGVMTGFLISSAPRLGTRGWSWAPSTPYFRSLTNSSLNQPTFRAFAGKDTSWADITDKGLKGTWLTYEFEVETCSLDAPSRGTSGSANDASQDQESRIDKIRTRYLGQCFWGMLLQTTKNFSTFERNEDKAVRYEGIDKSEGAMTVVVGSRSTTRPSSEPAEARGWTWKGIYLWKSDIPLPDFTLVEDMLIE